MKTHSMKRLLLCILPFAAACSSVPQVTSYLTPYKIDIRQGNYVSQEMVAQLKPGQTKDQVRFILGTPLVADMFHADRWDYVYRFQPGRGEPELRRIVVYFAAGSTGATLAAPSARIIEIAADPEVRKVESKQDSVVPESKAPALGN
jgi:outer membrane protein assembly factor BamE